MREFKIIISNVRQFAVELTVKVVWGIKKVQLQKPFIVSNSITI